MNVIPGVNTKTVLATLLIIIAVNKFVPNDKNPLK